MNLKRVMIACLISASGGCTTASEKPEVRMTATIKDIMSSMIDPSADFMFESMAEISDENGIRQKAPQSAEEWKEVRHRAVILFEGVNLLTMNGRKVARPGENPEFPQVELHPDEIQALVDKDRESFVKRALRLQDAASAAIEAVDAKDTRRLFTAIENIDKACESCHVHYWYPKDAKAVEDAKQRGVYD